MLQFILIVKKNTPNPQITSHQLANVLEHGSATV